jgi:histidine triad (HIT) family protein
VSDCVFCRIVAGEIPARIVHQDADMVAFHDLAPQAPTHVLIVPRKHIASLLDATPEDAPLLGRLQTAAVEIARREGLDRVGFRVVTNTLEGAGQSVFHLHVHLLGGRRFGWPPG